LGEIIIECIKAATQTLFPKNRDTASAIDELSLSRKTVVIRVQNISEHFFQQSHRWCKEKQWFFLGPGWMNRQ